MSDEALIVNDKSAEHIDTVIVKPPKLNGYLAFTRVNEQGLWMQTYPNYPMGVQPPVSCPSPLFQTRAAAIEHIQNTSYTGQEALIFHVSE